tara:strand:+ start:927 stop:2171 length:1245 start_codon:yes stop_codon:yes gene_type:complete
MKKLKKGLFPFIIAASALSVSVSAAFYSVSGLSKLFAGAATEVMIMAGSLEVAKLVIASLLYQYWNSLNKLLRSYLVVAATVLVLITSMGIYGFLSAAYQETYSKLTVVENEKGFIQKKLEFYQNDVNRYDEEITRISSNISTLSNAKATSIQVRDTSVSGGVRTTISTTELRMAQNRINIEEENRKVAQRKREIVSDSLQKFQLEILALENNSSVAGELGPLKYLSGLTDTPMDSIINILLLVIIFVFDPLALALVVAANFAFDKAFEKNIYGEYSDTGALYDDDSYIEDQVKTDINDTEVDVEGMRKVVEKFDILDEAIEDFDITLQDGLEDMDDKDWEEAENRMDIIGQNGNEGEHYKDIEVIDPQQVKVKRVKKILQKSPSRYRVLYTDNSTGWISKKDYKENPERINYF